MNQVTVLLSTYNGEKYLRDQLESLIAQKNVKVEILVRDDGSNDSTITILQEYEKKRLLKWYTGENLRPAKSFMDLIYNAPDSEYYAFCDQDDVWLPDKLENAINQLKSFSNDKPALYYGRPRLANSKLEIIDNPRISKQMMLDYKSAIISSNATGCTMVFNRKLLEIVKSKEPDYIGMHDEWIHKVCIISRGNLYFDEDVHILYRQHGKNVIGMSNSVKEKINGHIKSLKTKECSRSKIIESLYNCYSSEMTNNDRELSKLVINYKKNIIIRIKLLLNNKIKTKYCKRNLLFKLAVLFNAF